MRKINRESIWENGIDDAVESWAENLDFSEMSADEFKAECLETIRFYHENDTTPTVPNYSDIVVDVAEASGIWID